MSPTTKCSAPRPEARCPLRSSRRSIPSRCPRALLSTGPFRVEDPHARTANAGRNHPSANFRLGFFPPPPPPEPMTTAGPAPSTSSNPFAFGPSEPPFPHSERAAPVPTDQATTCDGSADNEVDHGPARSHATPAGSGWDPRRSRLLLYVLVPLCRDHDSARDLRPPLPQGGQARSRPSPLDHPGQLRRVRPGRAKEGEPVEARLRCSPAGSAASRGLGGTNSDRTTRNRAGCRRKAPSHHHQDDQAPGNDSNERRASMRLSFDCG